MGNGVYKYCNPKIADKEELYGQGNINLKVKSIKKNRNTDKSIEVDSIIIIQSNIRIFLSSQKYKRLKEIYNLYVNSFLKNAKIVNLPHDEKLIKIEENFNKFNGKFKFIHDYDNFYDFKCVPILLTDENNEIYEGYWRLYKNTKFKKNGYGEIYQSNDIKIQGIWENDDIKYGRIYYSKGKVYEGEISRNKSHDSEQSGNCVFKYVPNGKGKLFPLGNDNFISGTWVLGLLNGEFEVNYPGKSILSSDYPNINKGKVKYENGEIYNGDLDRKFNRHGFGINFYPNGHIYEGYWKKDKFHGTGVYFSRLLSVSQIIKISDEFKFGKGKYLKAKWHEGILHGEGTVKLYEEDNVKYADNHLNCCWRLGKLIKSYGQTKNKRDLHENIFEFLNPNEVINLLKLKNRNILYYFIKNKYSNFVKLRTKQIMLSDEIKFLKGKTINLNSEYIIENSDLIENISEIFENYNNDKDRFIPIVAYKSNGGLVEKRFHYSNIFDPRDNHFCSNYLIDKKNNIEITGVFSSIVCENKLRTFATGDESHFSNREDLLKKQLLSYNTSNHRFMSKDQRHEKELLIENLKSDAKEFSSDYEIIFKEYKIDFYQIKIFDNYIFNKFSNNNSEFYNYYISIHKILVHIPIKISLYTFIINPVRTLAIFIHDEEEDMSIYDENEPSEKDMQTLDIDNLYKKFETPVINIIDNLNHTVIEFDSNFNRKNRNKKLVALIRLKNYECDRQLISLKKYYHIGKYITVRLIDQNNLYGYNKTGIEISSILFFGEIFKMSIRKN